VCRSNGDQESAKIAQFGVRTVQFMLPEPRGQCAAMTHDLADEALHAMRCLAFSGQSNSLFLTEEDGQSNGNQQAQAGRATAAFLL
jgi:hypothetical protein